MLSLPRLWKTQVILKPAVQVPLTNTFKYHNPLSIPNILVMEVSRVLRRWRLLRKKIPVFFTEESKALLLYPTPITLTDRCIHSFFPVWSTFPLKARSIWKTNSFSCLVYYKLFGSNKVIIVIVITLINPLPPRILDFP